MAETDQRLDALVQQAISGQNDAVEKLATLIESIQGQQEEIRHLLTALARAALEHRDVQIKGDATHSIIVIGNENSVQLFDDGHLARWWEEVGPDPSALLPEYTVRVSDAYAPLFFPLAHLSHPIPLHEVYVDLPLIKPQTEETLFRPRRLGQRLSGETIRETDELLRRGDRAALVGMMGGGKTTTLRYLAWSHAHRTREAYGQDDTLVPFYAALRDLAELWKKTERDSPEQFIWHLAKSVSIAMAGVFPAQALKSILQLALEQGNALILLDALDEFHASDQERSEFMTSLQTLFRASPLFKYNHVLITSRPYRFLKPLGFEQYAVQDLQDSEQLIARLGRAILKRARPNLSDEQSESWLGLLNEAVSSPRLRELSTPFYLTLMAFLGTSRETAEESVSLIKNIERPADPYRFFLIKTIDWEKQKGSEPHIESNQALRVLGYAGYYTFVERAVDSLADRVAADLPAIKDQVPAALEFWKRTGLLWENELYSDLSFRHSSFEAFAVALALRDMVLGSKAEQVNELWGRHRWDAAWQTIWELFISLGGGKQP